MKQYSDEQKRKLIEKAEDLAKELGSMSKVCELTGIKPAVMSGLRSGKYTGNVDAQCEVLEAYFGAREEAAELDAGNEVGEYVPTSISENVYAIIRNCQLKGGLAIACGDAGVGKTKAAEKFVADNPNLAIMITVNPCLKGIKSVLKLLGEQLDAGGKTIDDMWLEIADRLRDKMVIIFDEAQHLPIKTIESLRAFSDYFAAKGQTLGIVFIGNIEAVHNFAGNKRADFAQIVNRTKQNRQYYSKQITKHDIELLFPALTGKAPELELLHKIAQSRQALRGATNLFSNASDNENITYDGLIAMAKEMQMAI